MMIYISIKKMSSSSEGPMSEECGAVFVTVEELNEHRKAERKMRNFGIWVLPMVRSIYLPKLAIPSSSS